MTTILDPTDERVPVSRQITRLQALQRSGVELLVAQADVTHPGQMRELLAHLDRRFATLHGVIHLAGVTSGSSFQAVHQLDDSQWHQQLAPKVTGLQV